jgi:DNA-binding transcriptional MerR regulator
VRFYEAEGLLPPAPRTISGYRIYSERELDLLRLIAELRRVGLGVADVREVIRLREHGVPPPDRVVALLEARISGLGRELASLHEARGRLVDLLHRARFGVGHGADVRLCQLVRDARAGEA